MMGVDLHPETALRRTRPSLPLLKLALVALLAGCAAERAGEASRAGEVAAERGAEEAAGAVRTYTVRGVLRQLPSDEDPARQLLILHEAIPDFVNSEGYETGMPPMTMPFLPAPGVSLAGLAPGDRVEFTLRVEWDADPPALLTAIRPLAEAPDAPPG